MPKPLSEGVGITMERYQYIISSVFDLLASEFIYHVFNIVENPGYKIGELQWAGGGVSFQ